MDDVVFEMELVKQVEVNIDYILMLVLQSTMMETARTGEFLLRLIRRLSPACSSVPKRS